MSRKIVTFLLVIFSFLAAFLSGYLLSGGGFQKEADNSDYKSGNILHKFDSEFVISKDDSFQKPYLLSADKVSSFTAANNGSDIIYHEKGTGRVLSVNPADKEAKILSTDIFANFIKAIWSPDKKEVIIQFYSPSGARYKYYNFQTKESAILKNGVKSAVFSPDGRQIVSFVFSETDNVYNIAISNPTGSTAKNIFSTRLTDAELYWPQDNLLAFKIADNRGHSKIFSLTKDGALKEIIKDAKNLEINWSQDGQSFIYSAEGEGGKSELFHKNIGEENATILPIAASASKCGWSIDNKTIVCATPAASEDNEKIYKINVATGAKQLITPLDQNMRVREMILSNIENYAIFLNAYDEKLYFLRIE